MCKTIAILRYIVHALHKSSLKKIMRKNMNIFLLYNKRLLRALTNLQFPIVMFTVQYVVSTKLTINIFASSCRGLVKIYSLSSWLR